MVPVPRKGPKDTIAGAGASCGATQGLEEPWLRVTLAVLLGQMCPQKEP